MIQPRTMTVMSNMYKRKVRETLEINRFKTLNQTDKTFKVLKKAKVTMSPRTAGSYFSGK